MVERKISCWIIYFYKKNYEDKKLARVNIYWRRVQWHRPRQIFLDIKRKMLRRYQDNITKYVKEENDKFS